MNVDYTIGTHYSLHPIPSEYKGSITLSSKSPFSVGFPTQKNLDDGDIKFEDVQDQITVNGSNFTLIALKSLSENVIVNVKVEKDALVPKNNMPNFGLILWILLFIIFGLVYFSRNRRK